MRKTPGWFLSLLLIVHGSVGFAAPAKDELTPEERQAAVQLSAKFLEQWETDGKMSRIMSELYAPDFMERYVEQEKASRREEALTATRMFLPGMPYQAELLLTASTAEWRSFYGAAFGLFFTYATIALNHTAGPLLQGKEPDHEQIDKLLARVIPAHMRDELLQNECLSNLVNDGGVVPIRSVEELRRVTALLEKTLDEIKRERGNGAYKLTHAARKLLAKRAVTGADKPVIETTDEPFFGLPLGTRVVCVPMFEMFHLMFAKVDGEYKILCVHPLGD